MTNITIRTNEQIAEQIGKLAKAMDRPKNWVIEDALKQYIAEQAWQVEGINQAQKSFAMGESVALETVVKKLRTHIKRKQRKAK